MISARMDRLSPIFMRGSFNGRISAFQADSASSILAPRSKFNLCLAQSGRVLGLEPRGRRFESYSADQLRNGPIMVLERIIINLLNTV